MHCVRGRREPPTHPSPFIPPTMEIGTALKAQEETADRHKSIVSDAESNVSVRGKSAQYDSMTAKWIFKEACPLLVTTRSGDSERLELISDTVTQIEKLQAPLLVISSVGSHRSGISFLGNCLVLVKSITISSSNNSGESIGESEGVPASYSSL